MTHKLLKSFSKASGFKDTSRFQIQKVKDYQNDAIAAGPGIYVWIVKDQIVRLEKSEDNLAQRAKSHIKNDTWKEMKNFQKLDLSLVLFRLDDDDEKEVKKNRYLLHAFEQYLEDNQAPLIPQNVRQNSKRGKLARDEIRKFLLKSRKHN
jgi:hypothetical protein